MRQKHSSDYKSISCMAESVMLCFVQGLDDGEGVTSAIVDATPGGKDAKFQNVKNKLLRKSRSSGNFGSAGGFSGSGGGVRSAPGSPLEGLPGAGAGGVCPTGSGVGGGGQGQPVPPFGISPTSTGDHLQPPASPGSTSSGSTQSNVVQTSLLQTPTTPGGNLAGNSYQQPPPSPSHQATFSKCDKASLKHLSTSTPVMTAQAAAGVAAEPPSPKPVKEAKVHTTSKARQKKFLRHFPNVEEDEKVLNHYSCALIGDILLQGHLYITKNYFAFYSNVFGYVTKLLIPILTVENITKEKTARIIPNAVGVATSEDKHVFGSLISRDNTLHFMRAVWQKAKNASPVIIEPEIEEPDLDSSDSVDGESGRDSPPPDDMKATFPLVKLSKGSSSSSSKKAESVPCDSKDPPYGQQQSAPTARLVKTLKDTVIEFRKLPRQSLVLCATTLLLILLFFSAGVLLYRISKIQSRYSLTLMQEATGGGRGAVKDVYSDLLHWHSQMHSKSAGAVNNFLDSNLDLIAQVRQSLEALSSLLVQNQHGPLVHTQDSAETTPHPVETTKQDTSSC